MKEMKKINKEIDDHMRGFHKHNPHKHVKRGYAIVFALILVLSLSMYYFGPQITGMVVFSETKTDMQDTTIVVSQNDVKTVKNVVENANSLLLSGTVYGEGYVSVFLMQDDKKYLAYRFDGDAGEGIEFKDMCYGTCFVNDIGKEIKLYFEIENMIIEIDKIKYLNDKLIEFNVEPKVYTINYNEKKSDVVDITVTNDRLVDFNLLMYIEGPLTQYMSYQNPLVQMNSETQERTILVTVKLPDDLPVGTFDNLATFRYIPPAGQYVGSTPVETSIVRVVNELKKD